MPEKYVIFDYVLEPEDKLKIEYKGKDPFRIYNMLPGLMQKIFHGRGKNIFEDAFVWDVTTDPRGFYFEKKYDDDKFDRFTSFKLKIRAFGNQPSDPESPKGTLYMEIKPEIETKYEFKSIVDKAIAVPFIWLYHRIMYSSVRRRYMQILKENTFKLVAAIRDELGITYDMPELSGASARLDRT